MNYFTGLFTALGMLCALTTIADAQSGKARDSMCVFANGESRLVTNEAPLRWWEYCRHRVSVVAEGFTTRKLTFGLSAVFLPDTMKFSHEATGLTSEFIRPGEHVLILDAQLNDRHLAYSLSTNSYRFLNVEDIDEKLINPKELEALKSHHGTDQIFVTAQLSNIFRDQSLTDKSEIGGGRVFAGRSSMYTPAGEAYNKVECLRPFSCVGMIGWVRKTNLSEIDQVAPSHTAFPKIYEFPTRDLVKRCAVLTKLVQTVDIKTSISAKMPLARFAGAEFTASMDAALKTASEQIYDEDVRIERTVFTIFKFQPPRWYEPKRWLPKRVRVLIVDRVTTDCGSDNPKEHFELHTDNASYQITEPSANADITSSVAYTRFVAQALASTKGTVNSWALSHIASALSAQRR